MKLFKKKNQDTAQEPGVLSKGFQVVYKHTQNKWATWMSLRTSHFSKRTWMTLLVLFVLSGGFCCIYIAISSLTSVKSRTLSITPIKKPKHATETREAISGSTKLPEEQYSRIKTFRIYMDSLARSPSGKATYDSIIAYRPGLMDSVLFIEDYYQQLKQQ